MSVKGISRRAGFMLELLVIVLMVIEPGILGASERSDRENDVYVTPTTVAKVCSAMVERGFRHIKLRSASSR